MVDWKELAQQALIGAVYGGAAVLVVVQKFDVALLSAVAVGLVRGGAMAIVGYLEPKATSHKRIFESQHSKWKRIL